MSVSYQPDLDLLNAPHHSLILQRVVVDRSLPVRDLYWTVEPTLDRRPSTTPEQGRYHLTLPSRTTIGFESYFNSFFEASWRNHTIINDITLRLATDGPCTIRVYRRSHEGCQLYCERSVKAGSNVTAIVVHKAQHFRQHGIVSFEILAGDRPVTLLGGAWLCEDVVATPVSVSAVICTLKREASLGRILDSIACDPAVSGCLNRIIVVNQGPPTLAKSDAIAWASSRLGAKLEIVQQANFGGAGGFGRGILEAIDDPDTTHVVLLDDDIVLEPDSLLRMTAFFALSNDDMVVGGHMLDSMSPTTLYEAGAVISDRHWSFQPRHHGCPLVDPGRLVQLAAPAAIHYNGWWCCGIPLSLIQRHGMPLPCFIRGDDLEYGLRLHQADVATVAVPGIAVWHEPFYLKGGGWHLYYETRNMLVAAFLHQPMRPREVARRMARRLAMSLLIFRYYEAALILEGIRDFLAGPGVLEQPPQGRHAGLEAIRNRYPAVATSRQVVLEPQRLARPPRTTLGFIATLCWLVLYNAVSATRPSSPQLLQVGDLTWPGMRGVEHVAVETWWDGSLPTYRRSRKDFRTLALDSLRLLGALYRQTPELVVKWRAALPKLASESFWRSYLNLGGPRASGEQTGLYPPIEHTSKSLRPSETTST